MVNIIPAGKPFYPTDHCGVLRVYSDDIVPRYLALALQVAGEYEKFSRSNRASTQRIKGLTIQIPEDTAEQQRIVYEIENMETAIKSKEAAIDQRHSELLAKFVELFGDTATNSMEYDKI